MAGERKRMHRSQGEQPAVVETASETRMRFMEGAATLDAAASTSAAASMTKSMAEEEQEHNVTVELKMLCDAGALRDPKGSKLAPGLGFRVGFGFRV